MRVRVGARVGVREGGEGGDGVRVAARVWARVGEGARVGATHLVEEAVQLEHQRALTAAVGAAAARRGVDQVGPSEHRAAQHAPVGGDAGARAVRAAPPARAA